MVLILYLRYFQAIYQFLRSYYQMKRYEYDLILDVYKSLFGQEFHLNTDILNYLILHATKTVEKYSINQ